VAALVKLPVATLMILVIAATMIASKKTRAGLSIDRWSAICLGVTPIVYGFIAMSSRMNIGLRHVLPIFPFAYLLAGIVIGSWLCARQSKPARVLVATLGMLLLAEVGLRYPNYISFFNSPACVIEGEINLLSDSNLDWGQDLPLLAEWQRANPDRRLYLSYFGTADPAFYGIQYNSMPGGYEFGPPASPLVRPAVLAISATKLQPLHRDPETLMAYQQFRQLKLLEILGGTIYLFAVEPEDLVPEW
jgi:hypothetical protein